MSNLRRLTVALPVILLACGRADDGHDELVGADAGAAATAALAVSPENVAAPTTLRVLPVLAGLAPFRHLALSEASPATVDGGFGRTRSSVDGLVAHARFPRGLEARAPSRSDGALRMSVGDDDFWVESRGAELASSPGVVEGPLVVYRDAAPATDVVHAIERDSVEEIRLLHAHTRRASARWRLSYGRGVASARLRDGRVELLDATGFVRLATAPMFAVDAAGRTVPLSPTLDGATLAVELDTTGLALPIAIDPLWTTKPPMAQARAGHIAVALPSGKVVVACGSTSTAIEIYDPATNTWSGGGALGAARATCWGFVLTTGARAGQVLIFNGASSELYLPTTKTSIAGPVPNGIGTNAVMLTDGRILKAGGYAAAAPYPSEYYDPTSNTWKSAGGFPKNYSMRVGAIALAGGQALFAGGSGEGPFTPASDDSGSYRWNGSWAATASSLVTARSLFGFSRLSDGRALASGGIEVCQGMCSSTLLASAELFDPTANSWTATTALAVARAYPTQTTLATGKVLVTGGANALNPGGAGYAAFSSAELYDPVTAGWTTVAPMAIARQKHVATLLSDGSVLITGGTDAAASPNALASVELFAQGANGASCSAASGYECISGFCVDSTCCSTASCAAGYACNTTLKKGTCARPKGTSCGADAQCETGHCADGVCCDTACSSVCGACNLATRVGTCSAVSGAPATGHGSCPAGANVCASQTCNGVDLAACHFPGSATTCGTKACTGGVETHQAKCDGVGKCADVPVACGAYVCDAGTQTCRTKCSGSTDCSSGYYCDTAATTCVPLLGLGKTCSGAGSCGAGLSCVDGVCCGVAGCAAGSSCGVPGKEGSCAKLAGTACANDGECGSGLCADGVCCNARCDGLCEACDVAGSVGTCAPVVGAPHAGRGACPSDAANPCSASSCDGNLDRATCAVKAGSSVVCRAASCADGVATTQAFCVGDGTCPAAVTSPCDGYRCADDGVGCRTACTVDTDCLESFACARGQCKKNASSCSADGLSIVDVTGKATSCGQFRCVDKACLTACKTSDDCAPGLVCDTAGGTCSNASTPPAATSDSGGCATGPRSGRESGPGWAGLGLALLAAVGARARLRRADTRANRGAR